MSELELHIARLSARDFSTRRQSAEMLGEIGDVSAIKPLLKLLGDDYWQVRNTVADALLKIRNKATITPLLEFLRDEDPGIRNSAMSVLMEMGEDVIAPLTKLLLKDANEDVRIFSANTLGRLGEKGAVAGLVKGLVDADENVRFACAEGLGRLARPEAVLPLVDAMKKEETWSRFPYVTALGLIGDELACPVLLEMLADDVLSLPAAIALGEIGDISALNPLAALIEGEVRDTVVTRAAIVAIARLEKKTGFLGKVEKHGFFHSAVVHAIQSLGSEGLSALMVKMALEGDRLESESALSLLRYLKAPVAVEKLFPLLGNEDMEEEVRDVILRQGKSAAGPAVYALRTAGDEEARHLMQILSLTGSAEDAPALAPFLDSPETETVCEALKGIGMLDGREFFARMVELLSSPHENVRLSALGGISLFHGREWLYENAISLAKSENRLVRKGGYRILGYTSLMYAAHLLVEGLSDEEGECRAAAMQSLGYIGARDKKMLEDQDCLKAMSRAMVDEEKMVRLESVLAFARINNPQTRAFLMEMLEGEDRDVKNHVIRAIARCRIKEAAPVLAAILKKEDNVERGILLCYALGQCGGKGVLKALEPFMKSRIPELASEAISAVAGIGGDGLVPFLKAEPWLVRVAAINGLAALGDVSASPKLAALASSQKDPRESRVIIHACLKALAKIGTMKELGTALSFMEEPRHQYEAFGAVVGILERGPLAGFGLSSLESPVARRLACSAAGFSGKGAYDAEILACLKDRYPSVRRAAALAALEESRKTRGVRLPAQVMDDPDRWVRDIVKLALQEKK